MFQKLIDAYHQAMDLTYIDQGEALSYAYGFSDAVYSGSKGLAEYALLNKSDPNYSQKLASIRTRLALASASFAGNAGYTASFLERTKNLSLGPYTSMIAKVTGLASTTLLSGSEIVNTVSNYQKLSQSIQNEEDKEKQKKLEKGKKSLLCYGACQAAMLAWSLLSFWELGQPSDEPSLASKASLYAGYGLRGGAFYYQI